MPLKRYESGDYRGAKLADELSELQYDLGLFEYSIDQQNGQRSAEFAFSQNPQGYIQQLPMRITEVIQKVGSVGQLHTLESLVNHSKSIDNIAHWKDYSTKSLAAEEAGTVYQTRLTENPNI